MNKKKSTRRPNKKSIREAVEITMAIANYEKIRSNVTFSIGAKTISEIKIICKKEDWKVSHIVDELLKGFIETYNKAPSK